MSEQGRELAILRAIVERLAHEAAEYEQQIEVFVQRKAECDEMRARVEVLIRECNAK